MAKRAKLEEKNIGGILFRKCINLNCKIPWKPLNDKNFYWLKPKGRYRNTCKVCVEDVIRNWKIENPDKVFTAIRKSAKKRHIANPILRLYNNAKCRAKKKGIEFDINLSEILRPEYCPILGIKLEINFEQKQDNSFSIDRIDPSRGYVKGNVQIISWRANQLKSNGTIEEFEKILNWMKSQKDNK